MSLILGFIVLLCQVGIGAVNTPLERDPGLSHNAVQNGKEKDRAYDTSENLNELDKRCKMCPPGDHVQGCEAPASQGTCSPCTEGTDYTEYPNGLSHCLPCRRCKPDEEEVSRCTRTRNAVCRCKQGTYCPPDHPCEVCLRCTPSCPEGENLVSPCNATADIQCVAHTDRPPGISKSGAITIAVVGILLLVLILVCVYFCKKNIPGSKNFLRYFQGCLHALTRKCCQAEVEGRDNLRNEEMETQERRLLLVGTGDEPAGKCPESRPDGLPCQPAARHVEAGEHADVSQSFYIFIDNVPFREWRRFLRNLKVSDNEILAAEQNYPSDVREQHFQLLHSWMDRAGMEATVNVLLAVLCRIDLQGVADKITQELVQKSGYRYDEGV
ncbi:tumor necrosis factor receptor superfamily member 10A-like isoform X2 [Rhinatrema bivittatum]|uniref:tumor necrosis factor receptor superfamily member 10A-like isoform X2 n=1 Tax=Rhinatrema bivittatum TaxID=194408 RepID=UPI0011289002|nr:tumor necrosis factor receptor superfamily member 10A-like isoform X2 [Rhinatrema bivittatum]